MSELLRFTALARHYGARMIFENASGVIADGERTGLVGANGVGKSSLLRLLAGVDDLEGGTIVRARDARLGYLSQAASASADTTLRALLDEAFGRHRTLEKRLRELEVDMSDASTREDHDAVDTAMARYSAVHDAYERLGGSDAERRIDTMIEALGFAQSDLDRPTSAFSGGQRTRAMLGRVLLEEPDYLILDEPTNHLDIETVRWLEDFMRSDHRAYVVVSHDRYFLDRVTTQIWELERGALASFKPANEAYSAYVIEKQQRLEQAKRDYDRAMTERERQQGVIAELKTHGSHNYSHVRSREKKLAKSGPAPEAPVERTQAPISVALGAARRATTGLALRVEGLAKSYRTLLFSGVSFDVQRGERIAILGPNGAGKTTLLRILSGETAADAGTVKLYEGMKRATFAQNAEEELLGGQTATEAVMAAAPIDTFAARSLLGRLGLGGDAVDKPVESFSGGERRRIMLARLMAQSADLLLLDEPTNDLDIESREALESVLAEYAGALVVVSHDRYFLRRLVERVIWLHDGEWNDIDGGFDVYERVERGEPARAPEPTVNRTADKKSRTATITSQKTLQEMRRNVARKESAVAEIDTRRADIERDFADPEIYGDRDKVRALRAELAALEPRGDKALHEWERAVALLEEADA